MRRSDGSTIHFDLTAGSPVCPLFAVAAPGFAPLCQYAQECLIGVEEFKSEYVADIVAISCPTVESIKHLWANLSSSVLDSTISNKQKALLEIIQNKIDECLAARKRDHGIKVYIELMSDAELRAELSVHGENVGPVTGTTRSLYEEKLKKLIAAGGKTPARPAAAASKPASSAVKSTSKPARVTPPAKPPVVKKSEKTLDTSHRSLPRAAASAANSSIKRTRIDEDDNEGRRASMYPISRTARRKVVTDSVGDIVEFDLMKGVPEDSPFLGRAPGYDSLETYIYSCHALDEPYSDDYICGITERCKTTDSVLHLWHNVRSCIRTPGLRPKQKDLFMKVLRVVRKQYELRKTLKIMRHDVEGMSDAELRAELRGRGTNVRTVTGSTRDFNEKTLMILKGIDLSKIALPDADAFSLDSPVREAAEVTPPDVIKPLKTPATSIPGDMALSTDRNLEPYKMKVAKDGNRPQMGVSCRNQACAEKCGSLGEEERKKLPEETRKGVKRARIDVGNNQGLELERSPKPMPNRKMDNQVVSENMQLINRFISSFSGKIDSFHEELKQNMAQKMNYFDEKLTNISTRVVEVSSNVDSLNEQVEHIRKEISLKSAENNDESEPTKKAYLQKLKDYLVLFKSKDLEDIEQRIEVALQNPLDDAAGADRKKVIRSALETTLLMLTGNCQ